MRDVKTENPDMMTRVWKVRNRLSGRVKESLEWKTTWLKTGVMPNMNGRPGDCADF